MEAEYIISRTLSISIDIFAILTAVFAVLLMYKLWKKEPVANIKGILVKVFSSLAIGSILFAIAEIWWEVISLSGGDPALGASEIFWVTGMLFFIFGYGCFTFYMYKQHQKTGKGLLIISTASIAAGITYFLMTRYIQGYYAEGPIYRVFLDYFYPIASEIILVLVIIIYLFFKDIGVIGKPLLFLAMSSTFILIAVVLYMHYGMSGIYGLPGFLSYSFYSLSYLLSAVAFYMLWKMGKATVSKKTAGGK